MFIVNFIDNLKAKSIYFLLIIIFCKGRTAAHVAMIRGNETGVFAAMEGLADSTDSLSSSPKNGSEGSGGGIRGGSSSMSRSHFTRMISQRGSDVSLELNGLILYDDDGNEVHHNGMQSNNTSGNSSSGVERGGSHDELRSSQSVPKRPSHSPPAPPRAVPKPWQV